MYKVANVYGTTASTASFN